MILNYGFWYKLLFVVTATKLLNQKMTKYGHSYSFRIMRKYIYDINVSTLQCT